MVRSPLREVTPAAIPPGATLGGRIAGTKSPASASRVETTTARPAAPTTTGTIWPWAAAATPAAASASRTAAAAARSSRRRCGSSASSAMPRAAAAATAGGWAVEKIQARALCRSQWIRAS